MQKIAILKRSLCQAALLIDKYSTILHQQRE